MDDGPRPLDRFVGPALFAVAAAACVWFAMGLIGRPVEDLVGFVSDDAFYYLQTARNLAETGKPAFDGVHATNGYHPGWMAICTLLAKVFTDRETLLRAALWTSFALHLATSLLVVRLARRFVSMFSAWIVGALWAVNALPITLAMQGVEASLHMFALVLATHGFSRLVAKRPWTPGLPDVPENDLVRFGLSLGVLFWARTDAVVVVLVTLPYVAWMAGRTAAARVVGIVGGSFALCTVPWFVWSYATVGSFVQDSAAIKTQWADVAHASMPLTQRVTDAFGFLDQWWMGFTSSLLVSAPIRGVLRLPAAAVFFGFVAGSMVGVRSRRESRGLSSTTVWLFNSAVLLGFVYGAFFTDQMVWYLGLPGFALFFVGTMWTADALRRVEALQRPALHAAGGAALVVAAIFLLSRYTQQTPMPREYPWQRDVLKSQREFESQVPPQAKIGCFNAGIPAYFGNRTVVNLDGLVNHDLVGVYRRGELGRWLADERIAFIADDPLALARAQTLTKFPVRLTTVATAPLHGWASPTRFLWRVEAP